MQLRVMAKKHEHFAQIYLRLNGYFTIANFIAHKDEIWNDKVLNWSESDLLGVRMPYSKEICGHLKMGNDPRLVDPKRTKHEALIVEVKSGKRNITPNKIWRQRDESTKTAAAYILRTFGFIQDEYSISKAATEFIQHYRYENDKLRLRLIVIAHKKSKQWEKKGVDYITFDEICDFIIAERASCWIRAGMGVASSHPQWDELMRKVFEIANNDKLSDEGMRDTIKQELESE